MDPFNEAIDRTVGVEGDFSDDPNDSGGATRYGITEELARSHGYAGPMSVFPYALAISIYRSDFWDALRLGELSLYSRRIALELFDTGVNCGVTRSGVWLQRTLNALNRRASDYPDVKADGNVGSYTLASVRRFMELRGVKGEAAVLKALNAFQGAYYIELAENREKDEMFVFGWLVNRVSI